MPPEFPCCVWHEPAGAAPRPALMTSHENALQLDELMSIVSEVQSAGIRSR